MECIENQQGVLELFGGFVNQLSIVQSFDQRGHVVATLHGAQQLDSALLVDQRGAGFAFHNCGQESGLYISGLVHTGRNAVDEQVLDKFFFACRRGLQQFYQVGNLLFGKRLRRYTFSGALFYMFAIGF